MKTLPDNPSLDHLRRQAKDLLAGLRDYRPEVTLSEAQATLAERYGFRTWTDLKTEVDRIRGCAEVADPALARELAARYGLGEVTGAMRSMARPDDMGRQWSLETDQGRWLMRTMDTWWPIVDAETDVALQEVATEVGVLVPAPVRSRSGAIVESIGGHTWRAYQWLHSAPPLVAPVSATITYQVGGILARLHRLELPVDRISPWHGVRLWKLGWAELAAKASAKGVDWAPALVEAAPKLADLEAIGEGGPAAPPVLSHNALGPAVARVGDGDRLVVADWEHAGGQPPAWELADALMHWAVDPDGGVNDHGARAMVEGYQAEAGALPPLDLAMFRGAVTSLANYVSGEVEQALAAGDGEDQRYADRSVRHVLAHLPSRTSLEQLLEIAQSVARNVA